MTKNDQYILITDLSTDKIKAILKEEVDKEPSFLRCILTLNAHYFFGTSNVCGTVRNSNFILKNRRGPGFSIKAIGKIIGINNGSKINLEFKRPIIPDILRIIFDGYETDRNVIIDFLKDKLNAKEE